MIFYFIHTFMWPKSGHGTAAGSQRNPTLWSSRGLTCISGMVPFWQATCLELSHFCGQATVLGSRAGSSKLFLFELKLWEKVKTKQQKSPGHSDAFFWDVLTWAFTPTKHCTSGLAGITSAPQLQLGALRRSPPLSAMGLPYVKDYYVLLLQINLCSLLICCT